ncbi:MAG: pilin [Patescibacteria group bacterium]
MKKINHTILSFIFTSLVMWHPPKILAAPPEINVVTPDNPLPFDNAVDLIMAIINYALSIAGLVSVVFIILGGFQYITSAGNEETHKKATKTLTFAVIGLLVVFAAYAIKVSIENAINYQSSTWPF